jgi:palmitoyltransferase
MTPNKRKNGFECPRSAHQIITSAAYLCTFGLQFAFIVVCIEHDESIFQHSVLIIHSFLGLCVFSLWFYCTAVDPECLITDKPIPECYNCCGQKVERTNLYCTVCCKRIYGMDHHCIFLNNCVGSRNYGPFIALLIFASIHMMFDTGLTVYFESNSKYHNYGIRNYICMGAFQALLGIQITICALFSLLVFALLGLHIFLNFVAFRGTFNWVLFRRELRFVPLFSYSIIWGD